MHAREPPQAQPETPRYSCRLRVIENGVGGGCAVSSPRKKEEEREREKKKKKEKRWRGLERVRTC